MTYSDFINFLQGASNAAAGTVSGPVDLINAGLGYIGAGSKEPVGGSAWMQRKGLTRKTEGKAGLLGEALGMSAPIVAAAKAPQIASGLLKAGNNLAAPRTLNPETGAIVWHGSPHKFDRFDSSKIGTGEGAQAYGHGLYLAESPDVARGYARKLSDIEQLTPEGRAARYLDAAGGDTQKAIRLAWDDYNAAAASPPMMNAAYSAVEALKAGRGKAPSLYKIDLPDDAIARMLDWDKPLSQQAPAMEALRRTGWLPATESRLPQMTGAELYGAMSRRDGSKVFIGDQKFTADYLRKQGIPGIRYLDGGSRGTGQGTSNFVVFPGEEGLLKILERNGMPLR